MIKKILAIIAAALCAGAIVEFIPEPSPADAAGVSAAAQSNGTSISDSNKPWVVAAARLPGILGAVCTQAWPYYEPACLRDGRRTDGKMRVVRVIITDRSVAGPTSQTRR
jgi:hypothetical protein